MSVFQIVDGDSEFKIIASILNIEAGGELLAKKAFEFKSSEKLPLNFVGRTFTLRHNGKAKCSNFHIGTLNLDNSGSSGHGECLCFKECIGLIQDFECKCESDQ